MVGATAWIEHMKLDQGGRPKLGHVVIWDVVTGRRIAEVGDEFDTVLAADISPDQSLVAFGGPPFARKSLHHQPP